MWPSQWFSPQSPFVYSLHESSYILLLRWQACICVVAGNALLSGEHDKSSDPMHSQLSLELILDTLIGNRMDRGIYKGSTTCRNHLSEFSNPVVDTDADTATLHIFAYSPSIKAQRNKFLPTSLFPESATFEYVAQTGTRTARTRWCCITKSPNPEY